MSSQSLAALRVEREALLDYCAVLDPAEWAAPSRAAGWSVQDVIAHLTANQRALVTPAALPAMATKQIERLNDRMVAKARSQSPVQVLAGFEAWSRRGIRAMRVFTGPGIGRVPLPIGELGAYPLSRLPAIFAFDWHTHLRHDIAPALDRPAPSTDNQRMSVVLSWMMALLQGSHRSRLAWLDAPLALTLHGPGGDTWRIEPAGKGRLQVRVGSPSGTAAQISGQSLEFPAWSTTRTPWRDSDVKITGDAAVAERFLDALNLV